MKAIIENCGLDLSLYDITREYKETNRRFEQRCNAAKTQIFLDLAFFNTLLSVINLATNEDDLRSAMQKAFEERNKKNHNVNKIGFTYGFGRLDNNYELEEMQYMKVYQADNPNNLIYVEL